MAVRVCGDKFHPLDHGWYAKRVAPWRPHSNESGFGVTENLTWCESCHRFRFNIGWPNFKGARPGNFRSLQVFAVESATDTVNHQTSDI